MTRETARASPSAIGAGESREGPEPAVWRQPDMSTNESRSDKEHDSEAQYGGVKTDTKFVEFDSPSLARSFRFMITQFEPERMSIPHGSGYVGRAYRQYTWISQNSKLQVTDSNVYELIDKIDELSHHDHRESDFWAFLRWLDGLAWWRIPEQYRTAEDAWGERTDSSIDDDHRRGRGGRSA